MSELPSPLVQSGELERALQQGPQRYQNWQRNTAALVLILLSLVMLYPGLTQPMMNLTIEASLPLIGRMEFYNQTQSIMQSVRSLFDSGNQTVAILILLFSVIVPLLKAIFLLLAFTLPMPDVRYYLHKLVLIISKWSMADVFVVGIFMAYMAGQAHPSATASLHNGFYYFTAYCILSILGAQLMRIERRPS
ncbi:paraquat-inducible protein A [Marinagarivorans algicola]|uniref:paraquat-inducible protein A n=1 Tax=Marinagarivorans algicola TaxID=1513270 RepID=UPI0006B5AC17|nr:paraquat-inducible protein A [Marinagarivorans algicola]